MEKVSFANTNHNKDGLVTLISVKVDSKTKTVTKDKEVFHQENYQE